MQSSALLRIVRIIEAGETPALQLTADCYTPNSFWNFSILAQTSG
jgi:hypothetical protein